MSIKRQDDMVILVADGHLEATIRTLLKTRRRELRIAEISFKLIRHPRNDSGCRTDYLELLRLHSKYRHVCVIFDLHGSGAVESVATEAKIEDDLSRNGWNDRCMVIAIEPELENWVWTGSQSTAQTLGWNSYQELIEWLMEKSLLREGQQKPENPKKAMHEAMKAKRLRKSASVFREITEKADFQECQDRAFLKFQDTLRKWFPGNEQKSA